MRSDHGDAAHAKYGFAGTSTDGTGTVGGTGTEEFRMPGTSISSGPAAAHGPGPVRYAVTDLFSGPGPGPGSGPSVTVWKIRFPFSRPTTASPIAPVTNPRL